MQQETLLCGDFIKGKGHSIIDCSLVVAVPNLALKVLPKITGGHTVFSNGQRVPG